MKTGRVQTKQKVDMELMQPSWRRARARLLRGQLTLGCEGSLRPWESQAKQDMLEGNVFVAGMRPHRRACLCGDGVFPAVLSHFNKFVL